MDDPALTLNDHDVTWRQRKRHDADRLHIHFSRKKIPVNSDLTPKLSVCNFNNKILRLLTATNKTQAKMSNLTYTLPLKMNLLKDYRYWLKINILIFKSCKWTAFSEHSVKLEHSLA